MNVYGEIRVILMVKGRHECTPGIAKIVNTAPGKSRNVILLRVTAHAVYTLKLLLLGHSTIVIVLPLVYYLHGVDRR